MGFFDKKRGVRRPGGQRPPQRKPPKTPEKPMLLPPLDDGPRGRHSEVSGFDPTVASDAIRLQQPPQNPTRNLNGQPPPLPRAKPPPPPETISDEPSEIQSAVMSYESKLQELDAIKAPDETLLEHAKALHRQATRFLERMKEAPHMEEELQRLNGVVERLSDKIVELNAKHQFEVFKEERDRPPPRPVQVRAPTPVFGESIEVDLSFESPAPAQIETQPQEQPGRLKRFITSPMTWAIISISAFTALLFSKNAFKDIAESVGKVLKAEDPPSEKLTMLVYGAVSVVVLAVTSLVTYLRNRKAEKKEKMQDQQQNGGPTQYS